MAADDTHCQVKFKPRCRSCKPKLKLDPRTIKVSICKRFLSVFGQISLDEKLLQHDIRRRSKSARLIRNLLSCRLSDVKTPEFFRDDLEKLSMEELKALRDSFMKKLNEKRKEHIEVLHLKAKESEQMVKVMNEIRKIEETTRTVLKPCFNVLPHSDDMARVLLLN